MDRRVLLVSALFVPNRIGALAPQSKDRIETLEQLGLKSTLYPGGVGTENAACG